MIIGRTVGWGVIALLFTFICAALLPTPIGFILPFIYGLRLLKTPEPLLRRIGLAGVCFSALCVAVSLAEERRLRSMARHHRANTYLNLVVEAGERYMKDRGHYPKGSDREIAAQLLAIRNDSVAYLDLPSDLISNGTQIVDAWRSPVAFAVDADGFRVTSPGPDKILGTRDDISVATTITANKAMEGTAR